MDELEISGKRYVSTRRAAREHKYHSDYIGQLIRGGKVQGQKVGRSWYVDEVSLASYLGKELPVSSRTSPEPLTATEGTKTVLAETENLVRAPMPSWKKIPEVAIETESATKEEKFPEQIVEASAAVEETEKDAPASEQTMPEDEKAHRIEIRNQEKEETKKNITYVSSNAPVFPAIKIRSQKNTAPTPVVEEASIDVEESKEAYVSDFEEEKQIPSTGVLRYGVLGMIGLLAFIVVGGLSYVLSYQTTVEGDQMTASIILTK